MREGGEDVSLRSGLSRHSVVGVAPEGDSTEQESGDAGHFGSIREEITAYMRVVVER